MELDIGPGMLLFQGENGQGKSNLLEAIYLLAIAKSPKASTDRELVRWQPVDGEIYSRVAASVHRGNEPLRVQIDFRSVPNPPDDDVDPADEAHVRRGPESLSVQKYLRVNGVPRRASDLVGQVTAVMFSADDLELVYGSPTVRRRYLDILISQLDRQYLRTLQRYQRVVTQRNSLLKSIREGKSRAGEIEFWDDELAAEGKLIMAQRHRTIEKLSELSSPVHEELTGNGEALRLEYQPNVPIGDDVSEDSIEQYIRKAIQERRQREIAQAVTISGPHRDDLGILLNDMDVAAYASRGQARTVVLAMKLAEAGYLRERRHQEPILLLDDVFSELDASRRAHILDTVSRYEQSFITTADVDTIEKRFLTKMSRFVVSKGRVEKAESLTSLDEI
jgi:DNA replication and repair protein RecF